MAPFVEGTMESDRLESILREEELELTLYCEQDLGWHPTTHSVYRFTPDKEWLHLLKERWNQIGWNRFSEKKNSSSPCIVSRTWAGTRRHIASTASRQTRNGSIC